MGSSGWGGLRVGVSGSGWVRGGEGLGFEGLKALGLDLGVGVHGSDSFGVYCVRVEVWGVWGGLRFGVLGLWCGVPVSEFRVSGFEITVSCSEITVSCFEITVSCFEITVSCFGVTKVGTRR